MRSTRSESPIARQSAVTTITPQTCSVEVAARRLGMGRESAYLMIDAGIFPVPVIRVGLQGRTIKVPIKGLDDLLGPLPAESADMAVR